jgi:hypothetical protein
MIEPCDCDKFEPIELDRTSILRRIKQSDQVSEGLLIVAENEKLRITLYRCESCGHFWQSGWDWAFQGKIYYFQVPPISTEDWLRESYVQPASLMVYNAVMAAFAERATLVRSDRLCGLRGPRPFGKGRFAKWSVWAPRRSVDR